MGVSAQVVQTYSAQRVLKQAKAFDPQILTLLGGHQARLRPDEFNAPYIDAIVLGEGVPAFQEIVARRAEGDDDFRDVAGLTIPHEDEAVLLHPSFEGAERGDPPRQGPVR